MSAEMDIMEQLNAIDLSKVDTSFPILATGIVSTQIAKCEFRKDTEKKGADAKPYLYVEYNLTAPWKTVEHDGVPSKPVNPGDRGSTFNERIYVGTYEDKKDGSTKWYGVDRITRLRESVFGKAPEGTKINPQEMLGQNVQVRLLFEAAPKNKDTGEIYGPRTSVAAYIRKAK